MESLGADSRMCYHVQQVRRDTWIGAYTESVEITTVATAQNPLVLRGDFEGCYTGDAGPVVVDAMGRFLRLQKNPENRFRLPPPL